MKDDFERDGFVHLPEAFSPAEALTMQEAMWRQMAANPGIQKDDTATWPRERYGVNGLNCSTNDPAYKAIAAPRLQGAIDALLGAGTWRVPKSWGGFLVTFPVGEPEAWRLVADGWHWDGNPNGHLIETNGVFIFTLFSELRPGGGGTLILRGSHRLINRFFERLPPETNRNKQKPIKEAFFRSHPYLAELTGNATDAGDRTRRFMAEDTAIDGVPVRVVELTGAPGDAYICHPSLLHAPSLNCAALPRFMRVKALNREGFAFNDAEMG